MGMAGSVWEVDVETGDATELTRGGTYHSSPSYSPDGRWIVYTADYGGERIQLEVLDTESGETRALTDDDFVYADPVFSPDGSRIAYVSSAPNGFFNVYIRGVADGDWAGPEVAVTSDNDYGNNRLYFDRWTCTSRPRGCRTERNSSSSRTGTCRWARGM